LWLQIGSDQYPLSEYVDSLTALEFNYYDRDGAELVAVPLSVDDRRLIKTIKVSATFSSSFLPEPLYLTAEVEPGNLSDFESFE